MHGGILMSEIVQHYDCNPRGRDFVVGDIHGCFSTLRESLDDVDFNPESDRLFSVGDLIDRGPESTETLQWLDRPWFHACIGNHENMALQSRHNDSALYSWVLFNGGEWWLEVDPEARQEYINAFLQLPVAIEIRTSHGCIGIVHADVPQALSWQEFIDALESGDAIVRDVALWSRRRAQGLVTAPVEGIDRVVCGHTINYDCKIHIYANVWYIDTGAVLSSLEGGHLTLLTLDNVFQDSEHYRLSI